MKIKLTELRHSPYNTREDYGDLSGLKASIKKFGLTQPFLVRRTDEGYELAFGSRRYEALKQTGVKEIDVEIRNISSPDMATMAICENVHRKDLNVVEEARAYEKGLRATKLPLHEFAQYIATSDEKIKHYLAILNLPKRILNKSEKYNRTQLISLGRLQTLSKSVMIMLENRVENFSIPSNFLQQIISSCESIYSSNLPTKTKQDLCYEIIFHDYSAVPPENFRDVRTFSDILLSRATAKYQEGLRKTEKARAKLPRLRPKKVLIKRVIDIIHIDQKIDDVTFKVRETYASIQKAIDHNYYKQASKRSQGKFKTAVNHLVSGIEKILEDDKET